jgi:hypothetical protein
MICCMDHFPTGMSSLSPRPLFHPPLIEKHGSLPPVVVTSRQTEYELPDAWVRQTGSQLRTVDVYITGLQGNCTQVMKRDELTGGMPSSGTIRRVAIVRTDVSEELSASIIRVTRIGELGTTYSLFLLSVRRFTSYG